MAHFVDKNGFLTGASTGANAAVTGPPTMPGAAAVHYAAGHAGHDETADGPVAAPPVRASFLAVVTCLLLVSAQHAGAEPERAGTPPLTDLVHYATDVRGSMTERFLASPSAIDAMKNGTPIPPGALVVVDDNRGGELYRYLVMQKGTDAGTSEGRRHGNWQFQWVLPSGQVNKAWTTTRCMSCHQSVSGRDFVFTSDLMRRFTGTPVKK